MTVDEFLQLGYKVVLTPVSEEDGGGWFAEIPELNGCCSDGATPEEALQNLKDAKAAWFRAVTKRNGVVPLPSVTQEEYSGKFTLRIPKSLHRRLAAVAESEGVSLNQYLLSLIAEKHAVRQTEKRFSWKTTTLIRQISFEPYLSWRLNEDEREMLGPMPGVNRINKLLEASTPQTGWTGGEHSWSRRN